jgi:hypothetical protein
MNTGVFKVIIKVEGYISALNFIEKYFSCAKQDVWKYKEIASLVTTAGSV